ncbi:hypothetical protein [Brevundimonas sp. SORGH_AS_0993]|uniref:hypothetical protein n=1 Tax=Brevundimonas sp. SORGH_AS_0993 TaxID=3041794 RepID=UPI00277D8BF8|nr:hypothetical protein [Brevundimonas sp. SORGH_AS_0993]MDQ1154171.1 hypothetical protein [Brevundimonas sp. SORGH_AS_0993]
MRFWGLMLGGLLIWAAHFLGLYALSSAADVARGDAGAWNGAGVVFSLACLAAIAVLGGSGVRALKARPDETRAFGLLLAVIGAALGGIGVVFQSLVLLIPA